MSLGSFPACPPSLKQIHRYLRTAYEHDERDTVVAYWCRLYALQLGLKIDRSSTEAKKLLSSLMDWLEKTKSLQKDNEAISHDIPAQAHLENYALKLFLWADSKDRAADFSKNVVKAFYTAGTIYDVLDTFGEPTDEVQQNRKYAKWKAAYIHNCLRNGETPVPGPMGFDDENFDVPSSSTEQPTIPSFEMPIPGFSLPGGNDIPGTPNINTSKLPIPDNKPEPEPEPVNPSKILEFTNPDTISTKSSGMQLSPEQMTKAQKYCKWASSALNYDDVPTAVTNLQKALQLLTTGVDE